MNERTWLKLPTITADNSISREEAIALKCGVDAAISWVESWIPGSIEMTESDYADIAALAVYELRG